MVSGRWTFATVLMVMVCISLMAGRGMAAWGEKNLATEKVAVNFLREVERGGYKVVSTEELKRWVDGKKEMLIVDTMPLADSYKKMHIPGAVQIEFPIPEMTTMDEGMKSALLNVIGQKKDRLIVFYCGFTQCTRSHNAAMWAVKLGYKNVYRHPGGIKSWDEAGYPVESAK